jgi:hypothetical protein
MDLMKILYMAIATGLGAAIGHLIGMAIEKAGGKSNPKLLDRLSWIFGFLGFSVAALLT